MSANLSQTQLNRILAATFQDLPEHHRGQNCVTSIYSRRKMQFQDLPEHHRGQNCVYRLADAAWAAFLVFFSQARAFLERRRDARRSNGQANAANLFGAGPTPTDPQIRNLLDPLAPRCFYAPFHTIFVLVRRMVESDSREF